MEPPRERHYRRQTSTRLNRYIYSSCGMYKASKLQRQSLKWKKDHLVRGKRKFPYSKRNEEAVKKTPEEAEEEERKKKLMDTANKLLSKIKSWSAEHVDAEPQESPQEVNESFKGGKAEEISSEVDESCKSGKTYTKPKRVAHFKSVSANEVVKRVVQKTRTSSQYDVNKETLKDFQNRIQHKLIEDIMQMPKENLQNMLNDPKINPIMEAKMTRLVKENKPLIAKKLRALAEDKIKSSGSSQILLDFDKLIDPVIETDLSVLPYELIKEMEKAFQVQFDYSPGEMEPIKKEVVASDILENFQEDASAYNCSTDDDEDDSDVVILDQPGFISQLNTQLVKPSQSSQSSKLKTRISEWEDVADMKPNLVTSQSQTDFCLKESTGCQTHLCTKNVSSQTDPGFLYGVPLPVEAKDNSYASLMEEVDSIQKLINKLNEKRFGLFLQLARMNPNENFRYLGNKNFIETVSNGSISLIESLTSVFRVRNYGESHSSSKVRCNRQRNFARHDRRK